MKKWFRILMPWFSIAAINLAITATYVTYNTLDKLTPEYWSSAYLFGYAEASRDWSKGIANARNAQEMGIQRVSEAMEKIGIE